MRKINGYMQSVVEYETEHHVFRLALNMDDGGWTLWRAKIIYRDEGDPENGPELTSSIGEFKWVMDGIGAPANVGLVRIDEMVLEAIRQDGEAVAL
jgi:hypothetical protein